MRGEAEFVEPVHLTGADLHLHPHRILVHQRGVQRAITIGLGGREIVLELARQELPGPVQDAQRAITVVLVVGENAEGHDVGHLFEADMALGHLAPDRIGMLFAAAHLDLQARLGQRLFHRQRDRIDLTAVLLAQLREPLGNRVIGFGLELFEGEQLHLAHIFIHPDPLGKRRVDIHRFARDPLALLGLLDEMQRAHIVQPVAQLDQQNADILAHRQQELAQILRRALVLGHLLDARELGHPVDQPRDLGPEIGLNILDRGERVLDRVVEQRGGDGFLIELEIGHQPGDLDRVAEIGIARGADLGTVLLDGVDIGAVEHRLVGVGVVFLDPFYKFILAQHNDKG